MRWLLLGRLVDIGRFEAISTLSDPPDEELTVAASDLGIVRRSDMRIQAFRLSTGALLWELAPAAPCRTLAAVGSNVISGCGDKVFAYAIETGKAAIIDPGPDAMNPLVTATLVVSRHQDGRVNVYDGATGSRRASRVLPELGRAFHQFLLPNPVSEGICALGLFSLSGKRFAYRAACYDDRLGPRWSQSLDMRLPVDPVYDMRQLGPRFLVLDDQYSVLDGSLPPGPGRGLVLRWRDGQVTPFTDQTFATFEGVDGERLGADSDIFRRARGLMGDAGDHPTTGLREAKVAGDDRRTFALVTNGATALAGIDRTNGRTLFMVPVSLGGLATIDVVSGMPVVRTLFNDRWVATVHDPMTGSVLYRDTRPPARGR